MQVPDEVAETLRKVPAAEEPVSLDLLHGDDFGRETEVPPVREERSEGRCELFRGDEEPVDATGGALRSPPQVGVALRRPEESGQEEDDGEAGPIPIREP
jgi:hypothetical protein